jgi:hypothetical protein
MRIAAIEAGHMLAAYAMALPLLPASSCYRLPGATRLIVMTITRHAHCGHRGPGRVLAVADRRARGPEGGR